MTTGQYRALVAYLNYWTPMYPEMGLTQAILDLGINQSELETIDELSSYGHEFDEDTGLLMYPEEEG